MIRTGLRLPIEKWDVLGRDWEAHSYFCVNFSKH